MPNFNNRLNLPSDTNLPFLIMDILARAAGISQNKRLCKQGDIKSAERNYRMKIRDGIPILTNDQKDHHKTKRFTMTLNKPMIIECLRQQQRNCWK